MRRYPYAFSAGRRAEVMRRDGSCILSRIEPGHVCRDVWGVSHAPDLLEALTLEHVKDASMMGTRAPNDAAHLVALCGAANFAVPNKSQRNAMRAYLRAVMA